MYVHGHCQAQARELHALTSILVPYTIPHVTQAWVLASLTFPLTFHAEHACMLYLLRRGQECHDSVLCIHVQRSHDPAVTCCDAYALTRNLSSLQ